MGLKFLQDAIISGSLTVTSGTSGDATLIISADTDNSEEADSPRLWFKADGDIIEGAIQHKDNTFDFISNVSSSGGFRFLTGTTNNTGTTDPETGATQMMSLDTDGLLTLGSASYTGGGLYVTGSASNNTYDVFVGKRKYPRIRLIDDAAVGDTEFSIWNLGDELRFGTDPGSSPNASLIIEEGAAALVKVNGQFETGGSIELGNASDTTIARSSAGKVTIEGAEIMTAGKGTGNIVNVVLKDMSSYLFYLFNDDYWYSAGTGTLAILGTSTDPGSISSGNSEYQSRVAAYIAPQACVAKKVTFTFYWSSSSVNSADIDFAFSKFTPISDGTAASIAMNKITATDHNGSYTEVKPYSKTFTLSGGNASLAAGDAFAMHMRTTGGSSSQRVIVYGTATIEFELS